MKRKKNKKANETFERVFPDILPALQQLGRQYDKGLVRVYDPLSELLSEAVYSEKRYRNYLKDHRQEIDCGFDHLTGYPRLTDEELADKKLKFAWNYQGIKILAEAVKSKVLTAIEAEVLAENVCYDKSFKDIAQEQGLTVKEIIRHHETALSKFHRFHR